MPEPEPRRLNVAIKRPRVTGQTGGGHRRLRMQRFPGALTRRHLRYASYPLGRRRVFSGRMAG